MIMLKTREFCSIKTRKPFILGGLIAIYYKKVLWEKYRKAKINSHTSEPKLEVCEKRSGCPATSSGGGDFLCFLALQAVDYQTTPHWCILVL
jgi:hypothetical protein